MPSILNILDLGCPLFIEKPVISDLKNSDEIYYQLTKSRIKTYVACNMRFHPSIEFLKNYIETNSMQQIDTQVSITNSQKIACETFQLNCNYYDFYYNFKGISSVLKGPSASSAIAIITAANSPG